MGMTFIRRCAERSAGRWRVSPPLRERVTRGRGVGWFLLFAAARFCRRWWRGGPEHRSADGFAARGAEWPHPPGSRLGAILALVEASIPSLVSDVETLLTLEVEEVAWVLLAHIASLGDRSGDGRVNQGRVIPYNFFNYIDQHPPYPARRDEVKRALMEAWAWLQREGLLVCEPGAGGSDAWFLSRRARRLENGADFDAYRKSGFLPRGRLHPRIVGVYPAFLRGEYDTAIFQAFREVEIAVRSAGGFSADLVGVQLMRQAFRTGGPLVDTTLPISEQEGMMHLFAGAIGLYKNPQSHRYVPTSAEEAAEVIMFASQLLRIVDRVTPPRS
jgi:uncharacterized protein (TIGR02391 family)